jgi:hypothetical protein
VATNPYAASSTFPKDFQVVDGFGQLTPAWQYFFQYLWTKQGGGTTTINNSYVVIDSPTGPVISGPGPSDGTPIGGASSLPEPPNDSTTYGRRNTGNVGAWVHITHTDITDWTATLAPYALLSSPIFTGIPRAPTAAPGTNTTQLATTAFVHAAVVVPPGVTDGSDASPGQVGEIQWSIATSSVPLTSGIVTNIISLVLPAGDWNVQGEVWLAGGTGVTLAECAISDTSATLPSGVGMASSMAAFEGPMRVQGLSPFRSSSAISRTYFLVAAMTFTGGTATATGKVWARRMR